MGLKNATSTGGIIISTAEDSIADSNILLQDENNNNFTSAQNIEVKYGFENISSNASSSDILVSESVISNGDNIIIVKQDNSINEIIVSGVTGTGPYEIDTTIITQGEIPSQVYAVDNKLSFDAGSGFVEQIEKDNTYSFEAGEFDLSAGLVAHYLFNNNSDDCAGTYDGTDTSMTYSGDAGEFNGTSSDVEISVNTFNHDADSTVSLWVKIGAFDSGDMIWFFGNYNLRLNADGTIKTTRYVHPDSNNATSTTQLQVGILYNIIVTFNTTSGTELYINSVSEATNSGISAVDSNDYKSFMNRTDADSSFLEGTLSNVRIYSDAKDQTFIDELYAEGYNPQPLPLPTEDGLVAYYPLAGNADDVFGDYDGVESASLIYTDDVEFGSVSDFNGDTDNVTSLLTAPQSFTLSIWVNVDNLNDLEGGVAFGKAFGGTSQYSAKVDFHNGEARMGYSDGSTGVGYNQSLTVGKWFNLIITYDHTTTTGNAYVNGIFTSLLSSSLVFLQTSLTFRLGTDTTGSYGLHGKLRDIRVYNKALTATEITDIYNYEKNFRSIDIDDGLVAFYPLKNNSLDNYYNEADCIDTGTPIYDGESALYNGVDNFSNGIYNTSVLTLSFWTTSRLRNVDSTHRTTLFGVGVWSSSKMIGTCGWTSNMDAETVWLGADDATDRFAYIKDVIDDDSFKHITIVYDTTYKIYVNGEEKTVFTYGTLENILNYVNEIGAGSWGGSTRYFSGVAQNMANVRQYNRVLSAEEISVIYNKESQEFIQPTSKLFLNTTRSYTDMILTGRDLKTKIELKSIEDNCSLIQSDVWSES